MHWASKIEVLEKGFVKSGLHTFHSFVVQKLLFCCTKVIRIGAMLSRLFASEWKSPLAETRKRPLAVSITPEKVAETRKRPRALSITPKKVADTKQRLLALHPRVRAETKKVWITSPVLSDPEEELLGSVHESDAAHWKRHCGEPSSSTCCRCLYIRNKAELQRERHG